MSGSKRLLEDDIDESGSSSDDEDDPRDRSAKKARAPKIYDHDDWTNKFVKAMGDEGIQVRKFGGGHSEKFMHVEKSPKKNSLAELAKANPEMVRPDHAYKPEERTKQALRWVSTVFFTGFSDGMEIQCYFDSGTVYVASNVNSINNQIAAAIETNKKDMIGYIEKSFNALKESRKSRSKQGAARAHDQREDRHYKKLLTVADEADTGYDGQKEVIAALKAGKVEVVKLGEDGLHAERRIKQRFGNIDLKRLGGVKRACFICAIALEVNDGNAGPFWPSKAATIGYTPESLAKHVEECATTANLLTRITKDRKSKKFTTDHDSDSESDDEEYEQRRKPPQPMDVDNKSG